MPRQKRTPAPEQPNAIVASAARVVAGRRKNLPSGSGSAWQAEAWGMLDVVGELEFYREWIANALSRCTLSVIEVQDDDTEKPVTDGLPAEAMDALFGGEAGQGEMLAAMGGHLAIPGETWLCGLLEPSPDPSIDTWRVLSREEVKQQGNRWQIDRGDGEPETYADEDVYLTRIWRPHPRKWVEAHSSVRSALPILRQLVGLSKRDAANIDSRLIGNGILAVPSEVTFSSPATPEDDGENPEMDPFLAALIEAGLTAIENPGSAEALFPILVKAPAEHLDKIKHITFASPLDDKAMEQQERLIKRLANSLDVPAEVLLGMADVNHWTGWLLDENAIKMHIEPLLGTIVNGLTTRYLWPILQGESEALDPDLRRFKVKGDTSSLRQRPNRSAEAQSLHGSMTITDAALARETGFDSEDLLDPTKDEFRRRVLMRLATTGQPEVVIAAATALGITLDLPVLEAVPATSDGTPASPPAPVETPETSRDLPQQEQAASLLAVAEVMVLRAVERGWNRAGRRGRVRKPVPSHDLDAALTDAWDHIPRAAALTGVDPDRLRETLDTYTRTLLSTGAEHDPRTLATALVSRVLNAPVALAARSA